MTTNTKFEENINEDGYRDRLAFDGKLEDVIVDVAQDLNLGNVISNDVITVGYEDYNTKVVTERGMYVFKIFSKKRSDEEVRRCADIVDAVCSAGIAHPTIHRIPEGSALYVHTSGLRLIVMDYVDGESFYDKGTPPNDEQLRKIVREAVKINKLDIRPTYLFDSWAIPNMGWMLDQTCNHLSEEGLRLSEEAFRRYNAIPIDQLPKTFVHGDLIKTNVLLGHDGEIHVIDFSVSNIYPRVQEIAVMATNLLFDEKNGTTVPLRERIDKLIAMYEAEGGELTDIEKQYAFDYALPGCAMEYMGSVNERIKTGDNKEIRYWENLGLQGLREALGTF